MIDPDFAVDPISKNIRAKENNEGESTSYVVYWVQYSSVVAHINEVENNEGNTIYVGSFMEQAVYTSVIIWKRLLNGVKIQ